MLSTIITNVYNGKVLDDPGYSLSQRGPRSSSITGTEGPISSGISLNSATDIDEIQNAYSGKVLDNSGYSTSQRAPPSSSTTGTEGPISSGISFHSAPASTRSQNAYSGKVLDDPGVLDEPTRTGIIQYDWNGGTNQQWTLG